METCKRTRDWWAPSEQDDICRACKHPVSQHKEAEITAKEAAADYLRAQRAGWIFKHTGE